MEKTLREELEEQFDIARAEGMLHSKDGKHSLSSEVDAEGIIEFISVRIKAKALTDEQLKQNEIEAFYNYTKLLREQKAEISFGKYTQKAVAAAQLQAILKELDIKENK